MPRLTGHCNPEETDLPGLPVSWSPTLFYGSGPVGLHLFPGLKKQLKCRHFSSDAEVIAAAENWLDGQHSDFIFSAVQKLEQRPKKWGVCWIIPSLVAVACFLPGRPKDLLLPPPTSSHPIRCHVTSAASFFSLPFFFLSICQYFLFIQIPTFISLPEEQTYIFQGPFISSGPPWCTVFAQMQD